VTYAATAPVDGVPADVRGPGVARPSSPANPLQTPRRVLFVDDEPAVLEALRCVLRPRRFEWSATFARSAEEAIEELERAPYDVVVTDLRMPGSDGADLLRVVRDRWPATLRITLSGYADADLVRRVSALAHDRLAKPCDPESLRDALLRAAECRERARLDLGEAFFSGIPLPAASPTASDGAASLEALAAALRDDAAGRMAAPRLAAMLDDGPLREDDLKDAARRLGPTRARATVSAVELLRAAAADDAAAVTAEVAHAALTAAIAARIAPDRDSADAAFVAAMHHDAGLVYAARLLPDAVREAERRAGGDATARLAAEHDLIGVDHARLGAFLLSARGAPLAAVDAAARHHDADAPGPFGAAAALRAAEALAKEASGFRRGEDAVRDPATLARIYGSEERLATWREVASRAAGRKS